MIKAGSPGAMRTKKNTTVSTASSVGTATSSRLTMYGSINARSGRRPPRASRAASLPRLLQRTLLVDDRAERKRRVELVAVVEFVAVRPDLELLVERDRAHLRDELVLRLFPQRFLLGEVGGLAGAIDLLIGDAAMGEVGDRGRRADDAARVEELGQVYVGDRQARRRVHDRHSEILANLGMDGRVIHHFELQVDTDLFELRLHDLHGVEHAGKRGLDYGDLNAVGIAGRHQELLRLRGVVRIKWRTLVGGEVIVRDGRP